MATDYTLTTAIPFGVNVTVTSKVDNVGYTSPYTGTIYTWAKTGNTQTMPLFEVYMMNTNHPKYISGNLLDAGATVLTGNATYDAILSDKAISNFFNNTPLDTASKTLSTMSVANQAVLLNVAKLKIARGRVPDITKFNVISNTLSVSL